MNDEEQRVPNPHGGQQPRQSIAQESKRNDGKDTGQSSAQMPSQQPILPYDRLAEPQTAGEIFQENQRQLTEHLVYPPVDPNKQLPPTKRVKMMPKTPKPTHHKPVRLNDPPEEGSQDDDDELMAEEPFGEYEENKPGPSESVRQSSQPGPSLQASTSQPGPSLQASTSKPGPLVKPPSPDDDSSEMDIPTPSVTFKQPHNYEELDLIGNGK